MPMEELRRMEMTDKEARAELRRRSGDHWQAIDGAGFKLSLVEREPGTRQDSVVIDELRRFLKKSGQKK
jgi:hypothetical protein